MSVMSSSNNFMSLANKVSHNEVSKNTFTATRKRKVSLSESNNVMMQAAGAGFSVFGMQLRRSAQVDLGSSTGVNMTTNDEKTTKKKNSRRNVTPVTLLHQNSDSVANHSFDDISSQDEGHKLFHPLFEQFKTKYECLTIKSDQESIFVDIQGYMFNVISKDDKNKFDEDAMKFVDNYVIFKETEASLLEKDKTSRGAYLVVNNADDKYLHETEDSALRGKEGKYSFVDRIGYNEEQLRRSDQVDLCSSTGNSIVTIDDISSQDEDHKLFHPLFEQFKTKYECLTIKSDQESIFVDIQGYMFNVISKDDKNKFDEDAMKFVDNYVIFKETEASLLEKDDTWRGAYLVVNNADDKYLHETEDSALRGKEGKYSFVGRIGYNKKTAEVFALGVIHKPDNFDDLEKRENVFTFQPCQGIYRERTRRWLTVCLQKTEGRGFRKEHFLLDSGSPKSIIIKDIVDDYNLHVAERNLLGDPYLEIEGVRIEFEEQPFSDVSVDGPEERTRNINLLGTNFLNNFVIIDDFCTKTILVLKRASPPSVRCF